MNYEQFKTLVVEPTLREIPKGYSEKAVLAICMIVAHESMRGEYIAQVNGPAKGFIQMESWVHDDVWKNSDSIRNNALKLGFIQSLNEIPNSDLLYTDLRYNVFMARQRLFMDVNPLPNEPFTMSKYLKGYWNSNQGKADDLSYYNDYLLWV